MTRLLQVTHIVLCFFDQAKRDRFALSSSVGLFIKVTESAVRLEGYILSDFE